MRLIDADVIIWNWRGQEDAALLLADSPFAVSAVTYMELVQGMRNRREFAKLRADLKLWQVRLLPVTEPISARAVAHTESNIASAAINRFMTFLRTVRHCEEP